MKINKIAIVSKLGSKKAEKAVKGIATKLLKQSTPLPEPLLGEKLALMSMVIRLLRKDLYILIKRIILMLEVETL